jgi:hypothetical protein
MFELIGVEVLKITNNVESLGETTGKCWNLAPKICNSLPVCETKVKLIFNFQTFYLELILK